MATDRLGNHVFLELVADDLLLGLVDFDHLLDASEDVAGEQVLDGFHGHLGPSEDFRTVVVLGVQDTHEPQPRRAVQYTRVKENRGNVDFALELLK